MEKGRDFHLTEDELAASKIEIVQEKELKTQSLLLIGSLITSRPFNSFALQSTMKGAWRVKKGFNFREISTNLFSFQFSNEVEKNRILNNGPWSFDRSLLVLREPGREQPTKMKFDHASFWVRFYDLPIGLYNRESAAILGARTGKVTELNEGTLAVYGKYLRIRVQVDITKQLRR